MTKEQTAAIMGILSAYYGQGKSDVDSMVAAWHRHLERFPFYLVDRAVYQFAEHDTRDYATFPSVGQIVEHIKTEQGRYNRIFNQATQRIPYKELDELERELVSETAYNRMLEKPIENLLGERETILAYIIRKDEQLALKGE